MTQQGPRRRHAYAILALLFVIAATLRIISAGAASLWFDEAVSYLTASLPVRDILGNVVKDPHPPFYYLILHGWLALVPDGDAWLRLLGIVCDLLLIPVVYCLGRRLLPGRRPALIASALVAISPFHVFYAHELRMYSLLVLLTSLTVLLYLKARKHAESLAGGRGTLALSRENGRVWWAAFTVVALLAVYTHLFASFVLVAIGLHALARREDKRALRRTVTAGLVIGLLFLPWLGILVGESQYDLGSLRPLAQARTGELTLLKLVTVPTFLLFGFSVRLWYSGLALFLSLTTIIFLLMNVRRSRSSRGFATLLLPTVIVVCVIGIPVAIHAIRPFFLPERTMAPAVPFLFIGLAWATTRRDTPLPYLVAVVAALMCLGTLLYLTGDPQKPPYRAAIHFIESRRLPEDAVLHTSDGSYLPALRYVDFPRHALLAGDPDPRKPRSVYRAMGGVLWERDDVAQKGQRLWLVVAREHSYEWQNEQAATFAQRYPELAHHNFGGIDVFLYQLAGAVTHRPGPVDGEPAAPSLAAR